MCERYAVLAQHTKYQMIEIFRSMFVCAFFTPSRERERVRVGKKNEE